LCRAGVFACASRAIACPTGIHVCRVYDGVMKLLYVLFAAALSLAAESLSDVKTVYLLPMSGGLDQHLAVSLTTGAILQVVTDPEKADAIFTDTIGTSFEDRMKELFQSTNKKKDDGKSDEYTKPTMSPLSRGKGDIFLVDRKSHVVLWSMYATPKSSDSGDMNRLAGKIASQVQKDRKGK
jgi:hypothetical protein